MSNYQNLMIGTDVDTILKAVKIEASESMSNKDYRDSYSVGYLAGCLATQNRKIAKLELKLAEVA